jgi:hypothetical protein
MPDGQRLEWPDELRAGWVLVLPPANLVATPPPSLPEVTAPASTAPPSSTPAPPTTSAQRPRRPVVSVELPSGSVVAFSLWLAMSMALLVALLRQRRAPMPAPPEPGICRYQPETATVTEQLIASARAATQTEDDEATDGSHPEAAPAYIGQEGLAVPSLADFTCEDPGRVPVGERDGHTVDLDLAGVGALVLGEPDAVRVARAAVVTLLGQRGPFAAELLVVGDLLSGVAEFPGLRRAADLAAALAVLEAEVIHRRRLLDAEELDDFTSHRRGHPDDPLPALVLLADQVPVRQAGRLEALVAQGRRLGIGVLLLGGDVRGSARIELDPAGRVASATPAALEEKLQGAQMFSVSAPEAADLLGTLAVPAPTCHTRPSRRSHHRSPSTLPRRPSNRRCGCACSGRFGSRPPVAWSSVLGCGAGRLSCWHSICCTREAPPRSRPLTRFGLRSRSAGRHSGSGTRWGTCEPWPAVPRASRSWT